MTAKSPKTNMVHVHRRIKNIGGAPKLEHNYEGRSIAS